MRGGDPDAYLVQHVGYLLCLHQLLRLQMLRLHLTLLCGQSVDILLDILQIHVHNGDALLFIVFRHIHETGVKCVLMCVCFNVYMCVSCRGVIYLCKRNNHRHEN